MGIMPLSIHTHFMKNVKVNSLHLFYKFPLFNGWFILSFKVRTGQTDTLIILQLAGFLFGKL
jgi:hypothetical protein